MLARRESPLGGEPYAVAKIEVAPPPATLAPDPTANVQEAAAPPAASAAQVEAASGVIVTRAGGAGPPNARIIDVEQALAVILDSAPDPRLIETSRRGPLPRIGADGAGVRGLRQVGAARPEIETRRAADRADGRRPRPQRRGHGGRDRQTARRGDARVCALWRRNRRARDGSARGRARDRPPGAHGGLFRWDGRSGTPYAEDVGLRRRQPRFAISARSRRPRLERGGDLVQRRRVLDRRRGRPGVLVGDLLHRPAQDLA